MNISRGRWVQDCLANESLSEDDSRSQQERLNWIGESNMDWSDQEVDLNDFQKRRGAMDLVANALGEHMFLADERFDSLSSIFVAARRPWRIVAGNGYSPERNKIPGGL